MANPKRAVKTQTSSITTRIAGVEVLETDGLDKLLPGLSRMTPVELATASTPDNARTIPTKPFQFLPQSCESGSKLPMASGKCGKLNAPSKITTSTVGTE